MYIYIYIYISGLAIIFVGVIVLVTLTYAYDCGTYVVGNGSTKCPLPAWFDAEAVFLSFLGVGMLGVWVGVSQLACEPLDAQLTQRLVADDAKSKYFR